MIVADTHVLIWDALAPKKLSTLARETIDQANEDSGLLVCDMSLWEIAMLIHKDRIQVETDAQSFTTLVLQANRTRVVPISAQIASTAVALPDTINKDPVDRLLVATALAENVPLLTADLNLRTTEDIRTIW